MGLFKRKIKNAFDIARDIGVDEKKVKELVNGEREIRGETMDKVLKSINKSKVERDLEKLNIFEWYKETDLKKLREDFGYKKQSHLARAIGVDNGEFNRFENKRFDKINNMIIRMYDFYHNDFNRNVEKSNPVEIITSSKDETLDKLKAYEESKKNDITVNSKKVGNSQKAITGKPKKVAKKEKEKILNWYLNTDLVKLRGDKPQKLVAKESGIVQGSLSDLELHKITGCSKNVVKLYNYYHKNDENEKSYNSENENFGKKFIVIQKDEVSDDEVWKWYNEVEDLRAYGREFGYSKNDVMAELNLSYDQIRDFEGHHYKSATPIVRKLYNFYHNEENRREPIIWVSPVEKKKQKMADTYTITNTNNGNITFGSYENPSNVTQIKAPLTGDNGAIGEQIIIPYCHVLDEPTKDNSLEKENEELNKIIEEQKVKIASLERQVMLYEKLIEKL